MGAAAKRSEVVPISSKQKQQYGSIRTAAEGDERALLVALRDRVADDLDAGVPARDLASLSKRLMEIQREIRAIDAAEDGDDVGNAAATPDESFSPS